MYDIKKIITLLDKQGFGIRGQNLFAGRFDDETMFGNRSSYKFAIFVTNDVVLNAEPSSFGSENTSYERDTLRIIVIGNESFYETNEITRKIYRFFRENKSLLEADIIQTNPTKPVAMAMIKGNVNKYNIFVDIIYKV